MEQVFKLHAGKVTTLHYSLVTAQEEAEKYMQDRTCLKIECTKGWHEDEWWIYDYKNESWERCRDVT